MNNPPTLAKQPMTARADLPQLGAKLREQYWAFEEGWHPTNHQAAAPIPVLLRMRELQDRFAAAPDRWIKVEYDKILSDLRVRLGAFVGCDTSDIVLVNNATTGVNVVLNSLTTIWEKGDKFLFISSTISDACAASLQFVVNTHPHLNLGLVPVLITYPTTHDQVILAVRGAILAEEARGGRIRLALIDAISSTPAVVVPWEELTKLFRAHRIFSLIDAAHQIGQLPVNLRESAPDFWVSNAHAWLQGHAGSAVLFVAKANQHLIHSIPTGYAYAVRKPSPHGNPDWVNEFTWNSSIDWSPFLSLNAALDFRKFCGGEERITEYCHALAIEAGEEVARILGTETMRNKEGEGELVASMVPCIPYLVKSSTSAFRSTLQQQAYLSQNRVVL